MFPTQEFGGRDREEGSSLVSPIWEFRRDKGALCPHFGFV